jgi:uncharacterized membrane protein
MSDPDAPKAPRPGRGLKIALAMSLALNLLILGLVGGAMLAIGPRGGGDDPRLRTLGLGPFALALDREDRDAVRGRIDREALRGDRRVLGASLMQLRGALLAEPFDRVAAAAALAQARGATEALQAHGHGALLDQVETMSADERAALAERLDRALRRMGGRDR